MIFDRINFTYLLTVKTCSKSAKQHLNNQSEDHSSDDILLTLNRPRYIGFVMLNDWTTIFSTSDPFVKFYVITHVVYPQSFSFMVTLYYFHVVGSLVNTEKSRCIVIDSGVVKKCYSIYCESSFVFFCLRCSKSLGTLHYCSEVGSNGVLHNKISELRYCERKISKYYPF